MQHEDYAYLDFIVVEAPQIDVLRVMAAYRAEMGVPEDADPTEFAGGGDPDKRPSVLGLMWWALKQRIFSPKDEPIDFESNAQDLFLHADEAAGLDRRITWSQDGQVFGLPVETRISGIAGREDWTLVEFSDVISGMSMTATRLSEELPEEDVFFFRRSGSKAKEPHFDFHHYRAGEQRRRVMSHCTHPTDGSPAWWEGHAEGPMLPFEDPAAYEGKDGAEILTAARQSDLLKRLDLPEDLIFDPQLRIDAVLISDKPGGAPLSVAL
ncbi:MAG: hypothetical protein AAF557_18635 [Pseudomonadota bacterium]